LGGNIGRPVFDLVLGEPSETIVLELSSFQLELCRELACRVAVWLNLTPDHLDRHGSLEGYVAAKKRIFAHRTPADRAVVAVDDGISTAVALELERLGRAPIRVSVGRLPEGGVGVIEGRLVEALDGTPQEVADLRGLRSLKGTHNHQNAAAAYAALRVLGLDPAAASAGLASFRGLPHRMEEVGRVGRVAIVNDSKATNPEAATKSLGSFENVFWIAGGRAGPGGFAVLAPFMARVRRGYLIGEAAEAIAAELGHLAPLEHAGSLEVALDAALEAARASGEEAVVLLAPACKSFDQFKSYEHRGDVFRDLVHARLQGSAETAV
jgi:UDP-N-acetylmuramoylalanine--D-glutamate ligase